jgi:hypothetical protein
MIPQSMEAKLNEVASWVKGDKRQAITPDQRAYLLDMLARIEEGFKISKKRRAETVFNRKMSTPNLQRAVDAKKQSVLDEVGPVNDHPDGPTGGMTPKLSAKDQQAVDWAKKNPNDLDAIAILKRLGVQ